MKTVKLTICNEADVLDDMRVFSSIVRVAFNRYQDGLGEKDVRSYCNSMFDYNSWFIQSAIKEAAALYKMNGEKRILFGGKNNLYQYLKGLIDKTTFKYRRMFPVGIQGEKLRRGNRLFVFDLDNQRLTYKPSKERHVEIRFLPMKKNIAEELAKVQELAEHNKITVSVKMSDKYVWLTYDESLIHDARYKALQFKRVLGIDMNPNYIGLSVIEFNKNDEFKVLHKKVFDLCKLTISSGKASTESTSKYLTNKLKHETIAIAHEISKLVDVWKCKTVAIEDLSIKPKDLNKGKRLNRLCNNKWERRLFVNKFKMLANLHKFNLIEVNPAYSSIVGNFVYGNENTPDMVAASIEIARRAYKKFNKGWFYPRFNIQFRDEQWKQTLGTVENWKALFSKIKETGLKYRFLLRDYVQNAVFSKNYIQKCYSIYTFA
ncbi:MAG: hypothetical protein IKN15_03080 [Bacteroidaceae bacterium]|nr:hypothetical protein [Prevotella sp.]MBR6892205.1 hypothetical protein [Bacteroidaceae bacterium]